MAKRKGRQKDSFDYISLPNINLDPQVKRSILIILILAFGAISLLGLFGLAGVAGAYLAGGITALFGWGRWLFPFLVLGLGFLLYRENRRWTKGTAYLGLIFFIISFQALLQLFIAFTPDPYSQAGSLDFARITQSRLWDESVGLGVGGGYVGLFLADVFIKIMGLWASLIVVVGLLLISLMLLFNTTLTRLIGRESWLARIIYYPVRVLIFILNKIFRREVGQDGFEDEEEEFGGSEEAPVEEEEEEFEPGFKTKKVREEKSPAAAPAGFLKAVSKKKEKEEKETAWKKSDIKIDLPLDLLSDKVGKPTSGDIRGNSEIIKRTLENFGIPVEMGEVSVGPTVTQYTFKPADGIKLSRITTLSNDLALSLAAHPIRIEAPIPGKSLVGIEVPNQAKAVVGLKEILSSKDFQERKSNLMVALGKDVSGKEWVYDLTKMPHLLVAGATNSGKSVCLNAMIVSLLYQNNPDDLKFIMVDPKRVELPVYNGIPHLLTPVITEVSKTINALKWCLNEMDRRFEILSGAGKRNIISYNSSLKDGSERMPYLVFIIDELADLMVAAARDIEGGIIRLAQMARAVGIHLILATQRPSVDVITGLIKANMPARIAFSVASGIDSRTILDSLGAEKLLGQGDMLFTSADLSKPKRLQGAYLSDNEIKKIVNYIKEHGGAPEYVEGITERQKVRGIAGIGLDGTASDDEDELLEEAKELIINSGKASASFLQRRLSVGYARAARILDLLEEAGVIGPSNGAKPREILISKEQYASILSQGVSGVSLHKREEAVAPDSYLGDEEEDEAAEDEEPETEESLEEEPADEAGDDTPVHASLPEERSKDLDEDEGRYFSR